MAPSRFLKLTDKPQSVLFADVAPQLDMTGNYGPRKNYAVNGSQVLSASDYLSERIEEALNSIPPGQPRMLVMRQYKNKDNRTRYDVTPATQEDVQAPWDAAPSRHQAPPQASYSPSQLRDFSSVVNDYASCLGHAKLICEGVLGEYNSEDVRSVATTLFIEANRSNMSIPPLYDENTQVYDPDEDDG